MAALALTVLAAAPFWGVENISWRAIGIGSASQDQSPDALALVGQAEIFWRLRVPRVVTAFLAGTALALSGMTCQALFRNPLAEPYTLGIASGAALGAVAAIYCDLEGALAGYSAVALCAFAGAVAVIAMIYGLTRLRGGFSTATMLLAGVAVSFFCASLILLLHYLSDFTQTFQMLRWVMGGLESVVGLEEVLALLPFVVVGGTTVFALTHELNLLTTGEELAASRGVEIVRTKFILFLAAALMVAAVVSQCGPIGFVGLMVPHICRLLVGPDHRWLMPATLLLGGTLLVLCDTLARTIMAPAELPVGILTALLGGPFFLWLLLRAKSEGAF
jgi:iron complex transport system permease protein